MKQSVLYQIYRYSCFILPNLLLFCFSTAKAIEVSDLYSAEVIVDSQSVTDRNLAIRAALHEVLIKVSGDKWIINNELVKTEFPDVMDVIQSYRYTSLEEDSNSGQLRLHVDFVPEALLDRLRQVNLPIWQADRPLLAIWFIGEPNGYRGSYSQDEASFQKLLKAFAKRRGLPITMPIMDLGERDALLGFIQGDVSIFKLVQMSNPYGSNQVLVIRLQQDKQKKWDSQWYLLAAHQPRAWRISGENLETITHNGIDTVADTMAGGYIQDEKTQANHQLTLMISNIDSAPSYSKMIHSLQNLTIVDSVQVIGVRGDEVTYELSYMGSEASLINSITLNLGLVPIDNNGNHTSTLHYRIN